MIVTHKNIAIHYKTFGKGAPIVFLHGFLENTTMWEQTIDSLSDTYHCILIDLLGHGHTESMGYIHTMEDMAQAVKAVLDTLTVTNVTFIGHSMGGYVALACIDLFTDIASGLVLLNSTSLPDSPQRQQTRTRAIEIVKKNPNAYTSMAIANLFAPKNRIKFDQEIKEIKDQASKISLQGIISGLEGMKIRKDRSSILANFEGSKIIVAGIKDPILPIDLVVKEAQLYKTDLIRLDGGHMSYLENKEEYLRELRTFLATL
ncbi:alpha/beta fold hydrolase [Aquimarina sp. I32.4]|uniref:alpha/beta fold hydrolase n=1 Tax=Aquimarina sp. I32.4 TaxID=2053903 RepID=UPI000CDF07F2|nr:alpha/beta hydrolase [Aquimarina sp. I32.4]